MTERKRIQNHIDLMGDDEVLMWHRLLSKEMGRRGFEVLVA